ncbi:MAG: hypothetical protein DGJ47_000598 [Rickettsiaceae bacterium]
MTKWITIKELIDYNTAMEQMLSYVDEMIVNPDQENKILLLEHNEVYTAGLSYKDEEIIDVGNIPVIYSRRGGKFTYHGPGQRVIYPVINLRQQKDIKLYVRKLEQWIINSLKYFDIIAFTIEGLVGIWVKDQHNQPAKIAAIGIKVTRWVAYHGIAVNIHTDISKFSRIIPCGIRNYSVTSLQELGVNISFEEFDSVLKKEFDNIFICKDY